MTSFTISKNSLITIRDSCVAKNSKTTLLPIRHLNFTTIEIQKINNLTVPFIPHNILPQVHLHLIDTKPFYKEGLYLDEIHEQSEKLRLDRRKTDWYHTGTNLLNYIGYSCIISVVLYILYEIGLIDAIFVCFKAIFVKLWNSLCFNCCKITKYNCTNINVTDQNNAIPLQVNNVQVPQQLQICESVVPKITKNRI